MNLQLMALLLTMFWKTTTLLPQVKADDIIGVWLTNEKAPAKIQIFKSEQNYYGRIVWLQSPLENKKPKPMVIPCKSKRNQYIVGLAILTGFEFDEDDEWSNGKNLACTISSMKALLS